MKDRQYAHYFTVRLTDDKTIEPRTVTHDNGDVETFYKERGITVGPFESSEAAKEEYNHAFATWKKSNNGDIIPMTADEYAMTNYYSPSYSPFQVLDFTKAGFFAWEIILPFIKV